MVKRIRIYEKGTGNTILHLILAKRPRSDQEYHFSRPELKGLALEKYISGFCITGKRQGDRTETVQ